MRLCTGALCLWVSAGCSGTADDAPIVSPTGGSGTATSPDGGGGAQVGTSGGVGTSPGAGAAVHIAACGTDNPAGLDEAQRQALRAGGDPGDLRFIYPYDGTVFPQGLQAPVLMWDGTGSDAQGAFVQLYDSDFAYEGCVVPDADGRFALPQDVWERAAAATHGKADPFQVELTLLSSGEVRGPIRQTLVVAPGSLKGSIYYNSYSSALAKAEGAPGGAVLRIPAGGQAELFVGHRRCAGCHSASADGSRLVTNEAVYALTPGTSPNPDPLRNVNVEFPGVSPDGDVYVFGGQLLDTDTGISIAGSGLPMTANHLSFSPDGTWVSFIDGQVSNNGGALPVSIPFVDDLFGAVQGAAASGDGKLAVMRYDAASRSFSDYQGFPQVSALAQWPAVTPDDEAVVYNDGATSDLKILDLSTGQTTLLARAMGFASVQDAIDDVSQLPFASEGEVRHAYFPVLAPVPVGGYFWVIFDSPRRYGNFDTRKIESGLAAPGGIAAALPFEVPGADGALASKQLWVAAIEVAADGDYSVDRSAPAFFLPGQEMGANNHRAFAALDPCRDSGDACSSGTECCTGFCGDGACEPPPARCSRTEEACQTSADCCEATQACISGYCSLVNVL